MYVHIVGLVAVFLFNAFANAASVEVCQQELNERFHQVLPVTLAAQEHRIEFKLESSFWSGTYGMTVMIDNQVYASFGRYAKGFAFPVVFSLDRSVDSGFKKIHAGMSAFVTSASLQKSQVTFDLSKLRAGAGRWTGCWLEGDSIDDILSLATPPAPTPTPQPKPEPVPEPGPGPKPTPPKKVGPDQSEVLPEGQLPPGKTLKPEGDR